MTLIDDVGNMLKAQAFLAHPLPSLKVELGHVKWLAPTGVLGITPLASVGPVTLGPSSREGSSARVSEVVVKLDLLQSLLQQKIMLQFQAAQAEVINTLIQL